MWGIEGPCRFLDKHTHTDEVHNSLWVGRVVALVVALGRDSERHTDGEFAGGGWGHDGDSSRVQAASFKRCEVGL